MLLVKIASATRRARGRAGLTANENGLRNREAPEPERISPRPNASTGRAPTSSLFSSLSREAWCAWASERPSCARRALLSYVLLCLQSSWCLPPVNLFPSSLFTVARSAGKRKIYRNRLGATDKAWGAAELLSVCRDKARLRKLKTIPMRCHPLIE